MRHSLPPNHSPKTHRAPHSSRGCQHEMSHMRSRRYGSVALAITGAMRLRVSRSRARSGDQLERNIPQTLGITGIDRVWSVPAREIRRALRDLSRLVAVFEVATAYALE